MARVCIIGLDGLTPELAFGFYRDAMPHLTQLAGRGLAGRMRSCVPAITIPAWSVMVTGVDPGTLGTYGFRSRADRGYQTCRLASSLDVRAPTLWSMLTRAGRVSRVIGVPQTHPPKPLKGSLVTDLPRDDLLDRPGGQPGGQRAWAARDAHVGDDGTAAAWTYPPDLGPEVERLAGGSVLDPAMHRTVEPATLCAQLREASQRRFALARAWARAGGWDLLMLVDMTADRLHHALWRYAFAETEPVGRASERGGSPAGAIDHPLGGALRQAYHELDEQVGALTSMLRPDDVVLVVSDHGAKANRGGFAINEWLLQQGLLVLADERPAAPTPLARLAVDWRRTRAWADGGFVGRVYLNVRGREPQGCLEPAAVDRLTEELRQALATLPHPHGTHVLSVAHRPAAIYREVRGIAPDLIVELGDLDYRAIGSVGHPTLWPRENDTGPDHANHARDGVLVLADGRGLRRREELLTIYDVAPTVLDRLGLPPAPGMLGRVL